MKRLTALTTTALAAAVALALTGCGGQAGSTTTAAADFPKAGSTIEWIVPSAAGAGNDILARIIAPAMQEDLGANIKVVNKEGGSQVVGLNYVAQSKPDGLTFGNTNIPSILGRYLDPAKKAAFDRSSFTPIGSFATNSVVIGVNKDSKYKTIQELFNAVKAEPGKITVGTDSRAGDDHINLRLLEDQLGLDFNIVHYNSGADKVAAIVSGETDFALGGVSSFFGQYKSGDIKLLSVIEDTTSPFVPDVPTMKSAGYDVKPMASNFALSVPSKTPKEVVAKLEAALKAAAETPAVQEKLKGAATQPAWVPAGEVSKMWEERETLIKPVIDELLKQQ
ncbi:tripartite tricarboxylate transporter substrate binding protein [Pseudarthrobacter sulfonivorans]|uniref:Bug family tripartite tricarboxylate transporter substrate binding protein n=1 Tax=Pseudarthrobacter sulfonivorans TaxID=121292 RepID=UPI002863F6E1|nr:tripartite tricarboxylate transporter substrate binding protein [Pseudarthrobacter sulfonivorans]MDR6415148.1 tripartite-type tricarboxylate transporter receptor subunit TctC [Pseudarthrobacter sulfonivorans]